MYLINKYALYGLGAFRTHFSFKQIMHILYRISPTDKTSNFNTKSEYTSTRKYTQSIFGIQILYSE